MTHEELRDKLLKGMGGKPPMMARDTWAMFLQNRATEFWINYDWIKNKAFWTWVHKSEEVDIGLGGSQGTTITIMQHGRIGH